MDASRTPEDKLRAQIRATELWLKRHVRDVEASPAIAELEKSLWKYLRHCERQVRRGKASAADVDRWCEQINMASFHIWSRLRKE